MVSLEITLILALAFILRLLFILGRSSDQDFHLLNTKWISRDGLKRSALPDSLVSGYNAYPSLPHFFIHLFPKPLWNVAGRLLNILYDLVTVLIVYFVARIVMGSSQPLSAASTTVYGSLSPAGWTALVYATSPILFPLSDRLKAMGGRTMGLMLVTIYLTMLGYAVAREDLWLGLACVPIGILAILASLFSAQVLVLFSLFASAFLFRPMPLVILAATFAVGLAIPPLEIKKILSYHYHLYGWYFRSIDKNSPITHRNRFKDLFLLPKLLFREPKRFVRTLFLDNSFFIAAYSLPALLIVLYGIATSPGEHFLGGGGLVVPYLKAVMLSGLAAFLLTSFRPFTVWGEAERYLEFASPAITLLFVDFAVRQGFPQVLFLVLLLNIAFSILNFELSMQRDYLSLLSIKPGETLASVLGVVDKLDHPRILTIPTKLAYLVSAYSNHPKAAYCYDWISQEKTGFRYMLDEREVYQFPKRDLDYFIGKYGINLLIVDQFSLRKAQELKIDYGLDKRELLMQNDDYRVYKLG